jgi:hypothetical protein
MTSSVPSVPPRPADDLVLRIAGAKAEAAARGFRSLAYFLDMALIEAMHQLDLQRDGQSEADLDPMSYRRQGG